MAGEDWETESSSGEEQASESDSEEADSGAEDGQGEPSVIADTIGSLEEPMTQVWRSLLSAPLHTLHAHRTQITAIQTLHWTYHSGPLWVRSPHASNAAGTLLPCPSL